MVKEIKDFEEKEGETSLWTNSMFSGMPTYQILAPQQKNIGRYIIKFFRLGFNKGIGFFIMGMIGFYILLSMFGVNHWLSIIGAIGFALSTNNIVLYDTGHITKLQTVMASAPIIAGVVMAYRGKYLLGATVFGLFMALNLMSNHPQMTYYLAMCMVIYVFMQLYHDWKAKNLVGFTKASGVLLVALLIAVGSSASKLITTYEYSQSTMRGNAILKSNNPASQSSSDTDGLAWDYAMSWSNGAIDLLSSFVPGVVGGSSNEPVGSNSALAQDFAKRGVNVSNGIDGPLYWGGLPSTSGPIYFGALIMFLFIFGAFLIRSRLKWWILVSVALLMLLSLGKNFEFFNRLFFDYFPLYNKFRTPNSILSVAAIFIPFLAFLGVQALLDGKIAKEKLLKALYISAGSLGFICLFLALVGPSVFDLSGVNDPQYQQLGYNVEAIVKDRQGFLRSDSLRSFAFIALGGLAIWLYLKAKIKSNVLLIALAVLTIVDLWNVDQRYLNNASFFPNRVVQQNFTARTVDNQILADTDPHYRVMDLSINTFNSSAASYFHKSVGGYHAAKLQRYQDLIDRHISVNNQRVLNMLNTKYYIVPDEQRNPSVQLNPAALGNVWFINNIKIVEDANAEINGLTNFDPAGDVLIHKEYSDYVSGLNPSKNGSIQLTDYQPNKLSYTSNTNSEQLAVFSEIWYGPDKGWQAYIDGEEVDHIRVNYALRGLRVPSGNHEIIFEFDPSSYKIGETISLISSILILAALFFFIWKYLIPYFNSKGKTKAKPKVQTKKAPIKKTTSRKKPRKKT
jgi:hypothetical protein